MTGAPLVFPRARRARRATRPGAVGELVALPTRAPCAPSPEVGELEAIGERIGMAAGRLLCCLRDGRRADVEAVIRVAEHVEVYGAAAVAIGGRPALVPASPGCG